MWKSIHVTLVPKHVLRRHDQNFINLQFKYGKIGKISEIIGCVLIIDMYLNVDEGITFKTILSRIYICSTVCAS